MGVDDEGDGEETVEDWLDVSVWARKGTTWVEKGGKKVGC